MDFREFVFHALWLIRARTQGGGPGAVVSLRPPQTMELWSALLVLSIGSLVYLKNHTFCCKPAVELFWSSRLPARSLATVVTTAL